MAILLTSRVHLYKLTFPKPCKASRSLHRFPLPEKIAAFLVSATDALQVYSVDAVTYWRNNVRVSVRPRRPCKGRGALFRLFLFPNPKPCRWLMLRFLLSSRGLRLRYRLLSILERAVSVLFLAGIMSVGIFGQFLLEVAS